MDDGEYRSLNTVVAEAMIDALPQFLTDKLQMGRGEAGEITRLATDHLAAWREKPAGEQRRSPLEIIRSAMFEVGPDLDEESFPATSRDLSEDAWEAHVAWGIGRAEAIAGVVPAEPPQPAAGYVVAVVSTNLMDRTRIEGAVADAAASTVVWRNPGAVDEGLESVTPAVALVDLELASAHDLIRTLAEAGVRTIAYGPHVNDHDLVAAKSLGATEALPRSIFFRRLPTLLPTVT